jgi:uncharacterized protein YndB with AHSA1/START domain
MTDSPTGRVIMEGASATLIFERRLRHPIKVVWQAITDSSELSKWYFSRGNLEPRLGGKVDFYLGPLHVTGSILVWNPPHVFEHNWVADRAGSPKEECGVIRWELNTSGDETNLKLTHRNLSSSIARNLIIGVHVRLDRLETFLADVPLPEWRKHLEDVQVKYR